MLTVYLLKVKSACVDLNVLSRNTKFRNDTFRENCLAYQFLKAAEGLPALQQ
jgi:hypothetical protein